LINISTRAYVGTGSSIAIAGFVISGVNPEQVLIRGVGPTLSQFSVSGVLAQPVLTLFSSGGTQLGANTGWGTNSNATQIAAAFSQAGAFVLPSGSADSALLLSLSPGAYTAEVSGLNNTTGNALIEVYQVPTPTPTTPPTEFINISTRAYVGTGSSIAIAGFVISGSNAEQVLIRGVGPTLSEFSVSGLLAQPVLTLFNSTGTQLATNTGWGTNSNASQINAAFTLTGAFALPSGSADSALLLSLSPGAYTAQVSGLNNTTGNALIEIYQVPTPTPTPTQ
jgi:hypothetical protein